MRPLRLYRIDKGGYLIWARDPYEARTYCLAALGTDLYQPEKIQVWQIPLAPIMSERPQVCQPVLMIPNPNVVTVPREKRQHRAVTQHRANPAAKGLQKAPKRHVGKGRFGRLHPGA